MGTAVGTIELDRVGRYLDANPHALALFGVTLDELRRHRIGDFAGPGLRHLPRALFLWLARSGFDPGAGESTILAPDGRETRVRCTSIRRVADRIHVDFAAVPGPPCAPVGDRATILKAWRAAERSLEGAPSDDERRVAEAAFSCLRQTYARIEQEERALGG